MSTKTNIWWISKASDFNGNILVLDEVGLVAAVTTADDARLIAAAPKMLEALRYIAKQWPDSSAAKTARAAISSAQGEAS